MLPRIDSDLDGMPDAWESVVGLEPLRANADENPDGDWLTNIQEYNAGTHPLVANARSIQSGISGNFTFGSVTTIVDSDHDGMSDAWEQQFGLNTGINDASGDLDGDGFSNLFEYNAGTRPNQGDFLAGAKGTSLPFTIDTGAYPLGFTADSDGDGMPDWWEAKYGLNLAVNDAAGDLDQDGVSNLNEFRLGTDPTRADLAYDVWALSALFLFDTIGGLPDTDGDGMKDWWEQAHGLNPLVNDAGQDPDGDGRTNLAEYNAGTDPQINDWRGPSRNESLAFLADTGGFNGGYATDTDHDGMPDWWEIKYSLNPAVNDANGNPDGDALTNIQEYNAGSDPRAFDFLVIDDGEGNVFVVDTGGRFLDSDHDGIPDWWERLFSGGSTNLVAGDDSDGDGRSNRDEYVSRTNPGDPASVFHVAAVTVPNPLQPWEWVLTWDTVSDRLYRVYSHTNLITTWPTTAVFQVQGDGAPKSYTNSTNNGLPHFYRITVELIPIP